jgi:hypothetical protein
MKRAFSLAAILFAALPPVITLAPIAQSNLAIAMTSPPSQGGSSGNSSGDPTVGLLSSDRDAYTNWKMAGLQSIGGIPNRATQCGAMISPRGGGLDDTANIQAAINACPAGEVVMLSAGTFVVGDGNYVLINKSITIRGAGAGSTILTRTNGAKLNTYNPGSTPSPMIILGPEEWNNSYSETTALTSHGAQGSYSVQVTSATGYSAGQFVLIDEDMGGSWQKDPEGFTNQVWAAGTFPAYELVYPYHNPTMPCDNAGQLPTQANGPGDWFNNLDRFTNEIKKIASVSGNTITFDSPLTTNYRVSHRAHLYAFQTPFTLNAGVESLTAQYADYDNIEFKWCAYCYAYKVETKLWLGAGFAIYYGFRDQLEEVYAHKPVWPVPGGAGYNISLANGSSEILVENSISVLANKVDVVRASGAGSVFGYNYFDGGYIDASSGGYGAWVETGINGSHMMGSHHILFEGNQASNGDNDGTWGTAVRHTFFRNWFTGFRAPFTAYLSGTTVNDLTNRPGGNAPLRAASLMFWAYYNSYIGNVLGTSGDMSGWTLNSQFGPGIYVLGYDSCNGKTDAEVAATAIIDGNYDYVQNQITWASTDTSHTLPASFYLSSKPAFFNAGSGYAWPWVNPTGSPQLYTNPAKARYDAGTPFRQP